MADWKAISLKDAINPDRGISYGIIQPGTHITDGVPIIRVSDIRHGRIDTASPIRVHPDIESQHRRTRLRGGELLITIVGTVGETVIVPEDLAGWNVARAVAVLSIKPEIGAYWVQLALRSPSVRSMIDSRLNTTVQATLNLGDLAQLPILMPPPYDRERIGSIIEAFDKKIEVNRQMNETLEAMARAIFKDWFVDFGPTRAKMAGTKPYLATEIWNLFPDRLDDEGKPNGWNVPKFEELVHAKQGKYLAKEEMTEVDSPDFPYPAWGGNGILGYSRKFDYDIPINLITCRGSNCGLIRLTESKASVSNNAFACRPRFGSTYFLHIYFLLESFSDCISGSAQPQITYTALRSKRMRFAVEQKMVERFSLLVEPLFQKILANKNEMENLAQIRDLLLPKLMSGEIRVRDAKSTSEAVTAMAS